MKEGGIPWGEWDAATRDTTFRGWVGCRNARIECSAGEEHTQLHATFQTNSSGRYRYIDRVRIVVSGPATPPTIGGSDADARWVD